MANENQLSNMVIPTDAISAGISEAFVALALGLGLVYTEQFAPNTNILKFRKSGSLTAQTVAESANYTVDANSELTDSSVSATAEKKVISTTHSVEAFRFGGASGQLPRFTREHGMVLARLFDADLKTLFSSIATQVTATSTLTPDDVLDARYNIVSNMKGAFSGQLVGMIDHKGKKELDKALTDTAAAAFNSQVDLGLLGTTPVRTGKDLFGVILFETDGLPTSGGDDVGCVWDPSSCFAAGVDTSNGIQSEIRFTGNQGIHYEFTSWGFWKVVEWNDTAGCGLLSDT